MSYAWSAPGFMQICMFLCQFTVNCLSCWGEKWQVWLPASHSPRACSVCREGAPVDAVLEGGDTRAALGQGLCLPAGAGGEGCGPSGGVGETPVMGNYFLVAYFPPSLPPSVAGVCLGSAAPHRGCSAFTSGL